MRTPGLILAAIFMVSPACATQSVVGKWSWQGVGGADSLEVENSFDYTLEFRDDGRYVLRADCNRGVGSYSTEGGELRLGPAAMMLAACPDDSHADRLLAGLAEGLRIAREGDRLQLVLPAGDSRLEFQLVKPLALPETRWNVRAVNDGRQAVRSVAQGTSLELSFSADGKASGSAGCNRFVADYTQSEEVLKFGAVAATRKMCGDPAGAMEQESQYLAALATVARFEVDGDRLALRSDDGALAVDLFSGVTGSVVCPEGCALPAEAELEIVLEDVSLADAPAVRLARQRILPAGGAPPFVFELRYDPAQIDPRHSYALRARVTGPDAKLLFTTTTAHPVISRDAPIAAVELSLDPLP